MHAETPARPACSGAATGAPASPLLLLIRVNTLQSWRRLLDLRQQSRLMSLVIGSFMAGYLGVAFWLFWIALNRLAQLPGISSLLVGRLFNLLFAILFVLLLLSNLVISYTNLFRNRETQALLVLPVPFNTIFQWKFIESLLLASWAFLFLISPFLAAYGLSHAVRWHFYPFVLLELGLFIILPGAAGTWLALLVARYVERRTFQVSVLLLAAALLAALAVWLRPSHGADALMETRVLAVLDKVLVKTRIAEQPFLPSYWLSSSVQNWAEGALSAAVLFGMVLLSNSLFFGLLALTRSGRFFHEALSAAHSRASMLDRWNWLRLRRRRRAALSADPGRLERLADLLPWLSPDIRALVVKDTRLFWRDTAQWAQTVVLFGLLGAYILNLRHFTVQLDQPFWVHLVSHLNLLACSLNLATLTTRFVYPQFSLEGKRLWIIGLTPLGMVRVVKVKFHFALAVALAVTVGLTLLSCHMLGLPWNRTVYFAAAIGVMSWTLTSLAVGLGVIYPNFKEDNPGKIVSGFGGTFCLVLSFLYILLAIALLAFGTPWVRQTGISLWQVLGCLGAFAAVSVGLGWVPYALALRRVQTLDL